MEHSTVRKNTALQVVELNGGCGQRERESELDSEGLMTGYGGHKDQSNRPAGVPHLEDLVR